MKELTDYAGDFNSQIRLEDFSKETLAQLLRAYSRLFMAVDGFWYLSVMQKVDEAKATECDLWVWEKHSRYEMQRIREVLKVKEKDVPAFLKILQFTPWMQNIEWEINIENSRHATLTIARCPTLEALEKEGKGRDGTFCRAVEIPMMLMYVKNFNTEMEITFPVLPPHNNRGSICCQWEFKLRNGSD
jgi:hypothetical protein